MCIKKTTILESIDVQNHGLRKKKVEWSLRQLRLDKTISWSSRWAAPCRPRPQTPQLLGRRS